MKKFRYKNILLYTSHQWCGNTEEYFAKNSENLAAFLLMNRVQNKDNVLRIYQRGRLTREINIRLSENFFLYYLLWYVYYIIAIFKYFPRNEKLAVITAHPYVFFAMTIQKFLRKIVFVYYIADYWSPTSLSLRLYELLKKFYHANIDFACYLGDGVNKIMNGKVINVGNKRTILLGVKIKDIKRDFASSQYHILFVGVIRDRVGLDIVYKFLQNNKQYTLKMLGNCDSQTYEKHKKLIREHRIEDRVFFPNRFFFDDELTEISKECFVGFALYTTTKNNSVYYADPGKVKTYTELGLPVIMTKTSSIYPYIQKFHAGEVIDRNMQAFEEAIKRIKGDYKSYTDGVKQLNEYFYYDTYYGEKFTFLEDYFTSEASKRR